VSAEVDPQAWSALDLGLVVRDAEASLRFYRDIIGCELDGELPLPTGHMWALRFGNSILKLLHRNEPAAVAATPSQLGYQTHYLTFHVLAVDAIVEACQRAGVTVVRAPYDFSAAVRNAIVLDPDSNVIELCRGVAWRRE
jgi:catechol 2,3-dioxygenase-like lactoylglutathione lyase family enzyme